MSHAQYNRDQILTKMRGRTSARRPSVSDLTVGTGLTAGQVRYALVNMEAEGIVTSEVVIARYGRSRTPVRTRLYALEEWGDRDGNA